jgi:hypothetical protein
MSVTVIPQLQGRCGLSLSRVPREISPKARLLRSARNDRPRVMRGAGLSLRGRQAVAISIWYGPA